MPKDIMLYVLSDTHCGHRLGLINPETELFDESSGSTYKPATTDFQEYLWDLYLYGIGELEKLSKGKEVIIIVLGDITHGTKYPEQLISTRIADQVSIVQQAMKPLLKLKNIKAIRLVFGTGSHEFGEGSSMLILKDQIKHPNVNVTTHGLLNVKNKLIDYSHHGPGVGIRDWLSGNEVRFYLKDLVYKELKRNNQIPDLVLRGHVHGFVHESIYRIENDELKKHSITVLPSMCGMGEFARQVSRSQHLLSNGVILYEINSHVSDPIPLIRTIDTRVREEI